MSKPWGRLHQIFVAFSEKLNFIALMWRAFLNHILECQKPWLLISAISFRNFVLQIPNFIILMSLNFLWHTHLIKRRLWLKKIESDSRSTRIIPFSFVWRSSIFICVHTVGAITLKKSISNANAFPSHQLCQLHYYVWNMDDKTFEYEVWVIYQ